ncbi:MAG TPA: hypothetical protein PKD99_04330 [Sphingopyxis sp.]|nr:hypothetical protein [Sphingopyxis sp.]HMP44311.1 hypothetical protein [Sphingopyxis sp.]HMQ19568.1 hypothetical protein [Sphingopyxis sp.]
MIVRGIGSLAAALGLALAPLSGNARILIVPDCAGGAHMLIVPGDPIAPDKGGDCAKACHVLADRRGKAPGMKTGCC